MANAAGNSAVRQRLSLEFVETAELRDFKKLLDQASELPVLTLFAEESPALENTAGNAAVQELCKLFDSIA